MVFILRDIPREEEFQSALKVLFVLQIEALDKLLGMLPVEHVEDVLDVLFILHLQLAVACSSVVMMVLLGIQVLLDSLDLLDLYLLSLLEGLNHHDEELLISIREEAVFNCLHGLQEVHVAHDAFHKRYSYVLVIIEVHVVVLFLKHLFAHLCVSGHTKNKGFQTKGYLVLDHSEVLDVLANTAEKDSLQ